MKSYFFDLDGTLTDARAGLLTSFKAALRALRIPALSDEDLHGFLGTPLPEMFRELRPAVSDAEISAGMAAFRAAYEAKGIAQNQIYPGVVAMLEAVVQRQGVAWVVTSKPEHYAVQVVKSLGIKPLLRGVVGAGLEELDTKTGLVARALAESGATRRDAIMLGDRSYDVTGALENGITAVGALWGYGSRDELRKAGCQLFAASPLEFQTRFVDAEPTLSGTTQPSRSASN